MMEKSPKVLVFGAGVLGSLYAARMKTAGVDVAILARGQRLADIREHGVVLEDSGTGRQLVSRVPVVDTLAPDDHYDFAMVIVRKSQLASALPALAANHGIPSLVFMTNSADGPDELIRTVGRERVMLGFPGAGGTREGHIVKCSLVSSSIQPTTIGELNGAKSERIASLAEILRKSGFPVAVSNNMDAWLKSHVALVSPIANAFYMYGGSNYELAKHTEGLSLLVDAVREGYRVLEKVGTPVTPGKLKLFKIMPKWLLVPLARRIMATKRAELVMAMHANSARDEMRMLAQEFQAIIQQSGLATPAIDKLASYC